MKQHQFQQTVPMRSGPPAQAPCQQECPPECPPVCPVPGNVCPPGRGRSLMQRVADRLFWRDADRHHTGKLLEVLGQIEEELRGGAAHKPPRGPSGG